MSSFLKTASKQVSNVKAFLRDAAGGNSIKYSAEKGAKHLIYFPYTEAVVVDEATGAQVVEKNLCAISGEVHEWSTAEGKFKATICLKDVVRKADDGTVLNDGSCPFCDRNADSWEIYKYRKALEEENCKLSGEQRKNHLDATFSTFNNERKTKEVRNYLYILVVKYRVNEQDAPIMGADGLPEYELKVMKLSASRVEKIQQQLANSGADLCGSELIFQYPSVDDRRLLVSQSTTAPVFPNNQMIVKYPNLINKINEDISKFEWEGIEKSFPEWAGMTSTEAKVMVDSMFEQWDEYKKQLTTNPAAKYLEYVVSAPTTTPSLGGDAPVVTTAAIPQVPNIPGSVPMPGVAPTTAPMPGVAPGVVPGVAPTLDPNGVFGNPNGAAPTVQI